MEDCYAYGPGYYPHRKTIVKAKNDYLLREKGRHDTIRVVSYFASTNDPFRPSDIHFKNCLFENLKGMLKYNADVGPLQGGTHWGELTLENVRFVDLAEASTPLAPIDDPFTVRMKNVSVSFRESATDTCLFTLKENSNTTIITE